MTRAIASLATLLIMGGIILFLGREGLIAMVLTLILCQLGYRARHGKWFDWD